MVQPTTFLSFMALILFIALSILLIITRKQNITANRKVKEDISKIKEQISNSDA